MSLSSVFQELIGDLLDFREIPGFSESVKGRGRCLPSTGGQSSESSYTTYERILEPHTAILIYTDGLTDCQNAEGTSFGERQLHKILVDCANHQIKSTYGRLETTILEFMGKNQTDDITFVVLYVE